MAALFRDVGRNDPCPCASGKKFKKCCLPLGTDALMQRLTSCALVPAFSSSAPRRSGLRRYCRGPIVPRIS